MPSMIDELLWRTRETARHAPGLLRPDSLAHTERLADAMVFHAGPVAEYVAGLGNRAFTATEWPTVKPPYPDMWIEWREEGRAIGVRIIALPQIAGDLALGIYALPRAVPNLGVARVALDTQGVPVPQPDGRVAQWYDLSAETDERELSDLAAEQVRIVAVARGEATGVTPYETVERWVTTALYTLAFLHCKNVEVVGHESPERVQHARAKRGNAPILRYHTLHIHPARRSVRGHAATGEAPPRALHIVRGNFATYGADRPLFGRLTGTYWRPAHVRGDAEAGATRTDYTVHPDNAS